MTRCGSTCVWGWHQVVNCFALWGSAMVQQILKPRGLAARALARRRVCHTRCLSEFTRANNGVRSDSYDAASSTLAPSQLSRYLLGRELNTQEITTEIPSDDDVEFLLKFQSFQGLENRKLLSPDGSPLFIQPPAHLRNVSNLHDLQSWFEKHAASGFVAELDRESLRIALNKCERNHSSQEILSTLNAFTQRCSGSDIVTPHIIHIEGLRCASQIHLPSALLYHVMKLPGPVQGDDADIVIKSLLRTIKTLQFNDLEYDIEVLLAAVAGEGSQKELYPVALFDKLLLDDKSYSTAIELLQLVGASQRLKTLSTSLLERLSKGPSFGLVNDAFSCLTALLKTGEVDHAKVCLEPLSHIMKDASNVPTSSIVSSQLLFDLQNHGLDDYLDVGSLLQAAEDQRMNEMQSLQMDGEAMDFSSIENLLLQIQQYGNSLSTAEIGLVIDALGDCEGTSIPLFTESLESGIQEFAWLPKWIPVARQSDYISDLSSGIGLLRARVASFSADPIGTPERSRNLFQLGYLVRRENFSLDDTSSTGGAYAEDWEQTGYLVAFDRLSSEFLLLFIGEDSTLFGPDHLSPTSESVTETLQQHPLIGSLSTLAMPTCPQDFHRDIEHVAFPVENAGSLYAFDIDPKVLTY